MLLFFTGWNTHCVVSLFVSFDTMNSLTACFFYLVYDKYINRVGRKYNIIFFDSELILLCCTVTFFWKDSAFNFEYGSESENAYLCKLSIT